jgi:replicative DNA helicase
MRSLEAILHDEIDKLEELSKTDVGLTGTPSGFTDLDSLTGGFQPGNLIVLAARPSMGKSAAATNIAEYAAVEAGVPVALFSLEMSETELAHRFLASQARVSSDDLRKGRVRAEKWPKVLQAVEKLARAPIFVDDSSDMSVLELRAKSRRLAARHGLGLVVVDYLQLMRPEGRPDSSRVEQIGQISRGLKILARELNVPVIAVSQLSRAVESRNPPVPMLSDLRESGSIEQDADVVMFIYRDEYYNKESERLGEADVIVAKHRNGPIGEVALTFLPKYPKFANLYRDRAAEPTPPMADGGPGAF